MSPATSLASQVRRSRRAVARRAVALQFRVTLREITPPVWRVILVPASYGGR